MTTRTIKSAKITRPVVSGAVQRERLFTLLDNSSVKPVTWICAPGGSGKSTLVAAYLDARGLPCIWYHCDEGDADLATFFYYMGLAAKRAAPRQKKALPLLTPEYLAGIPTFTRRYFETLYSRLLPRSAGAQAVPASVIVFDNFQDVPAASPFHDMIATGLATIPDDVRIVVLSRSEPPQQLARLQANQCLASIGYDDLRFTLPESCELVFNRLPVLDQERIRLMYEKTRGWAAGMVLMIERIMQGGGEYDPVVDMAGERFLIILPMRSSTERKTISGTSC